MNIPMIVWSSIIVLMIVTFLVRAVKRLRDFHDVKKHRRMIEIGKETEMFYYPTDQHDDDED